ncbi:hypothetical protein GCM10010339_93770 [Streptomyces alanosinicus]|uniref:PNPLA domain-containing protein n=2 Tax=Streptomyces alanosinicus TaxID=68171 RepID=A0A918MI28_9ACTN|nr:hypothetical protein GCM10010339_93770 [Streptomyces alanosinicus]
MVLATALGRQAQLPDLRALWDRSASLSELQEPKSPTSLLSGDAFTNKIHTALQAIGADSSLARPPQPVTLYVTATALDGLPRSFTDGFDNRFDVRDHRRLYRFHRDRIVEYRQTREGWDFARPRQVNDFSSAHTAVLVDAARATASFPGAFPPVSEQPLMANRVLPKLIHNDRTSCVMDGGILDNAPFMPVLESITKRRLDAPVRERVVVFIVPSTGRLREHTSQDPCEQRQWPGVAASALRYPTEADFRSSTEELGARLNTTIRDTQFDLFSRARMSRAVAAMQHRTALSLFPDYRRNRARAVLLDVRRRMADTESVTPLVATPELSIADVEAPRREGPQLAAARPKPQTGGLARGMALGPDHLRRKHVRRNRAVREPQANAQRSLVVIELDLSDPLPLVHIAEFDGATEQRLT